jgi:HlyD family secretion protein
MPVTVRSARVHRVPRTPLVAAAAALALAGCGREVPGYVAARRTLVQRVVASGRVMASARVTLGAVTLGKVQSVAVDEGDRVRSGQLLLKLEDAALRAALDEARARVAEAAARVDQVRGPGARSASEAVRQAELRVALAERELERTRALAAAGSSSPAQLDAAEKALALARSQQEGAAAQAESLAAAGADARLAAAALRQAQAAEAAARARLDDASLRAPCDGTVLVRAAEPGDVVPAGKALLVLARDGEARLSVQPDEKNLALLAPGQRARAVADAFPDAPFDAEVSFLAPAVDAARGTVEVRLRVPAPPSFLRTDMTVSVNVEVARRDGAVSVPSDAIRDAAGTPWVLALEGGRAVRRAVKLGIRGEGTVELLGGLAPGEAVVAPAAGAVEPGDRIRLRKIAAPELARAL